MEPNPRRGRSRTFLIPAYDAYKEMFSVCDIFNRNLKDRSWPMRLGGRGVYAEPRDEHNVAMSSILQNTFNVYLCINDLHVENFEYSRYCTMLADELFEYTIQMRIINYSNFILLTVKSIFHTVCVVYLY